MKSMKPMMLNMVATMMLASSVLMGYSSCSDKEDDPVATLDPDPVIVDKFQIFGQVYTSLDATPLPNIRIAALAADDTEKEVAVTTTQKDGYFVLSGEGAVFLTKVPMLPNMEQEEKSACVRLVAKDPENEYWSDTIYSYVRYTEDPYTAVPKLALVGGYEFVLEETPSCCGYRNIEMKPKGSKVSN